MRATIMFLTFFLLAFNCANAADSKDSKYVADVHRLSDESTDLDNPSWSPDKKWIAVSNIKSDKSEVDELWLFSTDGEKKRKLLGGDELAKWGAFGYSIWEIKWISNDKISFVLSDNDVDSFLITFSIKSPGKFKATDRDPVPELGKTMPGELKEYLSHYYPSDSDNRIDLDENPQFFHFDYFGGKWYVQYLRDRDLLVVDLTVKNHSKLSLSLSSDQIGDNLRFESIGNKILAVYPVAQSNDYIVDGIYRGRKIAQLFRITDNPYFFYSPADSHMYIYTRRDVQFPIKQLKLYRLADKLENIPTEDWHNIAFSHDGKNIAFIKIENNKRILYQGNFISIPEKHSGRRAQR